MLANIKIFLQFIKALKYVKMLIDAFSTAVKKKQYEDAKQAVEERKTELDKVAETVETEKQKPVSEQNNDNLRDALRGIKK